MSTLNYIHNDFDSIGTREMVEINCTNTMKRVQIVLINRQSNSIDIDSVFLCVCHVYELILDIMTKKGPDLELVLCRYSTYTGLCKNVRAPLKVLNHSI